MYYFLTENCENSTCSPGPEAESSAASFSDIPPFVLSKLNLTVGECCSNARAMESSPDSQSGTTCELSTASRGADSLTLCAAGSRARTSAAPERVWALPENTADYGTTWRESLAKYDRDLCSWKTRQFSLRGGSESFSETWPRWGLMRDGECWALDTLAHATDVIGFGFVPTVLTSEATGPGLHGHGSRNFRTWFRANSTARMLPIHGEIMMLWPVGWASDGAPLGMARFRQWLASHGKP